MNGCVMMIRAPLRVAGNRLSLANRPTGARTYQLEGFQLPENNVLAA